MQCIALTVVIQVSSIEACLQQKVYQKPELSKVSSTLVILKFDAPNSISDQSQALSLYTVSQKSEPPKHFATATANLHRFKWNFFAHTRGHLFLSSTSNFIRIPYSIYEMFNSFKLLSQISVTDTTYFLLMSSVVTDVTSVRVDKQTTCYQKRIEL